MRNRRILSAIEYMIIPFIAILAERQSHTTTQEYIIARIVQTCVATCSCGTFNTSDITTFR